MKHLSAQELTQKGEGSKVTLEGWVDTLPYALPTAEIDNRLNNLFRTTSQQAA